MKTLNFDVEGLSVEQIELVRQFIELMKQAEEQKDARRDFKRLLQKGTEGEEDISAEEIEKIASEAVAYARGNRW